MFLIIGKASTLPKPKGARGVAEGCRVMAFMYTIGTSKVQGVQGVGDGSGARLGGQVRSVCLGVAVRPE